MSEADIAVILNRLDQMENTLKEVHKEVKKTNGRVTE
jgi:tetrahydromethanopterin S-methyltransferase subunit G